MNKSELKNFAINARLELLQRVADRAALYGIDEENSKARCIVPSDAFHKVGGAVLTAQEISQRSALVARVYRNGYRQTMEEAAYTWFNRLIALRYMQAHNLLPVPMRVLPDVPGAQPQLVKEAQDAALDGVDMQQVLAMLDTNQTEALYKYLLIALCNALSRPLPAMFETISDYTELLFPDGLLKADSVLGQLAQLDEDCWNEIQVIGWLYQDYLSQKHDEVVDINGGAIAKEDIPAASCLYTTDWVVRYMVENSLGRLWQEGHPQPSLWLKWRYYMEEAEQEPQVAKQLAEIRRPCAAIQPEQITVLDPCMGSGHILVYAFDVLMDIYRCVGYTDRDAVKSIVENNLYGLDIDDRAAQLAYFALMMKACEYDRRFLRRGIQPHVCPIAESVPLDDHQLAAFGAEKPLAQTLLSAFVDAKEYGSILHVDLTLEQLSLLRTRVEQLKAEQQTSLFAMADSADAVAAVEPLLMQAETLVRKYDVVVTNPPYLNKYSPNIKRYVQENYADYKADLFSVFIYRNFDFCKENGYSAFMTPFVWMFIKSYEKLREYIIRQKSITTLIQMEYSAFEDATVPICTFVLRNTKIRYRGNYLRLSDFKGGMDVQNEKVLEAQSAPTCHYRYTAQQENFTKIPGMPIAYWASKELLNVFEKGKLVADYAQPKQGMSTCDVNRFTKLWYEVSVLDTNIYDKKDVSKWVCYNKGGDFRKWYGNLAYVVYWGKDGTMLLANGALLRNREVYFKPFLAWTKISSGGTGFRKFEDHYLFDGAGGSLFIESSRITEKYLLGMLNSKVTTLFLNMISPTLNYNENHIGSIPVIESQETKKGCIDEFAGENIWLSAEDWDSFETSWDFKKHPLI